MLGLALRPFGRLGKWKRGSIPIEAIKRKHRWGNEEERFKI